MYVTQNVESLLKLLLVAFRIRVHHCYCGEYVVEVECSEKLLKSHVELIVENLELRIMITLFLYIDCQFYGTVVGAVNVSMNLCINKLWRQSLANHEVVYAPPGVLLSC